MHLSNEIKMYYVVLVVLNGNIDNTGRKIKNLVYIYIPMIR